MIEPLKRALEELFDQNFFDLVLTDHALGHAQQSCLQIDLVWICSVCSRGHFVYVRENIAFSKPQ